ncbi:MAG: STAS domain-containing protein [Gemmataceae bacterium]
MSNPHQASGLERQDHGAVTVLRIKLPMLRDDAETEAMFQQAEQLLAGEGRSRLVLDCAEVKYLASRGLGRLVGLLNRARAAGGRLVLCAVPRPLEELLRISRLSDLLLSYHDVTEAVRSFG